MECTVILDWGNGIDLLIDCFHQYLGKFKRLKYHPQQTNSNTQYLKCQQVVVKQRNRRFWSGAYQSYWSCLHSIKTYTVRSTYAHMFQERRKLSVFLIFHLFSLEKWEWLLGKEGEEKWRIDWLFGEQ